MTGWPFSALVLAGLSGLAVAVALLVGASPGRVLGRRLGAYERKRPDRSVGARLRRLPDRVWNNRLIEMFRPRRPPAVERAREAYGVLGAELRAGKPAEVALLAAAEAAPDLEEAARVARFGGDVPAAIARAESGGRPLAVAWAVGERFGIGLALLVDRVADGIADDQAIRREVAAQLAGPRATARMLAGLPLLGLLLGGGLGGDPFEFLLGSGYGLGCLLLGSVLAMAGLWWVERLAKRAEP